jgi:zinc transport system substrate-binding protein
LLLAGAACGGDDDGGADGRLDVVAAFYPVAWAVDQVGGPAVDVQDLTPAGTEPHDLELTTGDVDDIEDADLVVVLGHNFQPAVEDAAARRSAATVEILDSFPVAGDDPHLWLDPVAMQEIVGIVERALAAAEPAEAASFSQRAGTARDRLEQLHAEYEAGLAECERRELVTAHDAFGHLARRYNLETLPIAGVDPEQEPDANRIAELADLVNRNGVTTVFTEELVSPDVANALAREAGGVRTETLNPLEGLTDNERDAGDDYISVMRANLSKLRVALGCESGR